MPNNNNKVADNKVKKPSRLKRFGKTAGILAGSALIPGFGQGYAAVKGAKIKEDRTRGPKPITTTSAAKAASAKGKPKKLFKFKDFPQVT